MTVKITMERIALITANCSSGVDDQIVVEPADSDTDIRLSIEEKGREVANVFLSLDDAETFCESVSSLIDQLRNSTEKDA